MCCTPLYVTLFCCNDYVDYTGIFRMMQQKKIIYSILCQHINCDADRENGYKYFQPLNRNFSCKPASKPYANSVSQNDQHQKSQDFCPGNSGKIADTCRNGNKHGVKKCHTDGDPCGHSACYQKRHHKDRAACTGERTDRSGSDPKEDQESHMVCNGF